MVQFELKFVKIDGYPPEPVDGEMEVYACFLGPIEETPPRIPFSLYYQGGGVFVDGAGRQAPRGAVVAWDEYYPPEEKAAGSGTQAEKEAGNIRDQLIRKGDALKILNGIISVPRKTPDESTQAFLEHLQKLADRIKALPAEGTAEPKLKPCPFCGGHATVEKEDGEISSAWVECDRCSARTRKHYGPDKEDKALTAWNQRCDPEE